MSDNSRIISQKAIFWFLKYAMAIGLLPSLILFVSLQVKLAVLSYGTIGILVGIWGVYKAFGAQMVVFDNLGITRKTLYFYAAGCHFAVSLVAFLVVYLLGL